MSTVQAGDVVAVYRGGTLYQAPADMSTVQDTDLLVIGRGNTPYKCTFADWKASQASVNKPQLLTPADGATDVGETPIFTSSAFAITGSGITHASSDWQVTLSTDTGFASPVVQSMADATNLVSWTGGPLQANTDYIARVRHNGSGGLQSPWSDVISFKTKSAFSRTATPGFMYLMNVNDNQTITELTSPVMFNNASFGNPAGFWFGVGVDGNLYNSTNAAPFALYAPFTTGDAIQVSCAYNKTSVTVLRSDGTLWENGYPVASSNLNTMTDVTNLELVGATVNLVAAQKLDGSIWVRGSSTSGTSLSFGTQAITQDHTWQNANITLPGGKKVKQMAGCGGGSYSPPNLAILAEDGMLYTSVGSVSAAFPGTPTTGTNASPAQWLTDVETISTIESTGNTPPYGGFSALMKNGELWISVGTQVECFGTVGTGISWQKLNNDTDWASPVMAGHRQNNWAALKKDGKFYGGYQTRTATQINYGTLTPIPTVSSVGNLPGANDTSNAPIVFLLP